MSSKLEPVIWLRDTYWSHWHTWRGGRTDVRTDVLDGYKTKFSHMDGLPYFLSYGAPCARTKRAPLQSKFNEIRNLSVYTNFCGIPVISRNCMNYRDVTEDDLGQLFVNVHSSRFSFVGRVRLHLGDVGYYKGSAFSSVILRP